MQTSPGKMIAIIVVVVLAVGAAVWSLMNLTRGPQGHSKMTPQQIYDMENRRAGQHAGP